MIKNLKPKICYKLIASFSKEETLTQIINSSKQEIICLRNQRSLIFDMLELPKGEYAFNWTDNTLVIKEEKNIDNDNIKEVSDGVEPNRK